MLIIIGKDPNYHQQWILECPICHMQRSVHYNTKYLAVKKGNSLCVRCSHLGSFGIENPEIILRLSNRHEFFIATCPDCHREREITQFNKCNLLKSGDSRCRSCARKKSQDPRRHNTTTLIFICRDSNNNNRWVLQCPNCDAQFTISQGQVSYRIRKGHSRCRSCAVSGLYHHRWKGNQVKLKRTYQRTEWYTRRKEIRARDNFTCQFPGCARTKSVDSKELSVHHIEPLRNTNSNSPENLISPCSTHHTWADHHLDESIPMLKSILAAP